MSENKILANTASVDSIQYSANQDDHVSMGTIAARKARDIIKNGERVLATEILAACQAIDFRKDFVLGTGSSMVYAKIREKVNFIENDVVMYKEIDKVTDLVQSGELVIAVEEKVKINI